MGSGTQCFPNGRYRRSSPSAAKTNFYLNGLPGDLSWYSLLEGRRGEEEKEKKAMRQYAPDPSSLRGRADCMRGRGEQGAR